MNENLTSNQQLCLSDERLAKLVELTKGAHPGGMWSHACLGLMELSNRRAADKLQRSDEPPAAPVAWRKVIDSAYDLHPLWVFSETGPNAPDPVKSGWEPLYTRPAVPPGECQHAETIDLEDAHARWCTECGAFHDGEQWIHSRRLASPPAATHCEWSEIEDGSGIYNTCKAGEEFHLHEGMELWPHCHWCGREIEVTGLSVTKRALSDDPPAEALELKHPFERGTTDEKSASMNRAGDNTMHAATGRGGAETAPHGSPADETPSEYQRCSIHGRYGGSERCPKCVAAVETSAPPKFKVGDRVRHRSGSTIWRIEHVSKDHGAIGHHRYYVVAPGFGTCGMYEEEVVAAERKVASNG